jgi:alpha-galactosidase
MKSISLTYIAALTAALATTHAAEITWSAHNITAGNGTADVSLAGTLLEARNGATSDAIVNGVTFKSRANLLLQSTIYGEATYGNLFDSIFANDNITTRRGSNPTNTGGSNYSGFLSLGQRSGRPASSGGALPQVPNTQVWATVNLSNLTIGNTYQIQIWASDTDTTLGTAGNKGLLLGNGANGAPVLGTDTMLLYEYADGATAGVYGLGGQYGIGTFTADATTQSFNVRGYNNLLTTPAASNQDHFSNGWQLRDLGVLAPDETAPAPDPMTFAIAPVATSDSSITMTATTATDDNDVEYLFTETSNNPGGTDGTWQDSPTYTDTGLLSNTQYTYTVTARDKSPNQNTTAASSPASATTDAPDTTAPTPNPMTFAIAPAATGAFSISMTATTATDTSGVEYFFEETSNNPGGTDSGWQDSPTYTDTGLLSNTQYTYTVTARDKAVIPNATDPSASASATTDDIDNIPPTPNPMTFALAPAPASSTSITMTATTASDLSGVQYFFDETSGNPGATDSGWQDSPTYTDTGLIPNTQYTYTVTARDKGPLQVPTTPSSATSTFTYPTAVITWSAHNIINSVGDVSQNGTLHDARNGSTSSQVVNGTLFESVANSGNLFDSLFSNDTISSRGYGTLVTKVSYQRFLSLGQRSGRSGFTDPPRTAPTNNWATVNFTGLTVGNRYEIQIWASDTALDGNIQRNALVLGNGASGTPTFGVDTHILYEVTDFGAGQFGTGTFVAVAPAQSFNVRGYSNLHTIPTANNSDHFSNGWQIRNLGPSVTDYDQWVISEGLTPGAPNTGPNDDLDRDGLTNEHEKIFGLDPADPASVSPYAVPFDPADGTLSYTRRNPALTGLDYHVWYSTDLTEWFADTGALQTPASPSSALQTVGVQISPALLEEPKLFIQLGADVATPPAPAPRIASTWGGGSSVTMNFTEAMDPENAADADNYTVTLNGGGPLAVISATLSPDGKSVTINLASSLAIGSAYDVSTANLTGSEGLSLTGSPTARFTRWDDHPAGIKVFILAGQSNMVGYGYSEEGGNPAWTPTNGLPKTLMGGPGSLRYLANNDVLYPEYNYTSLLENPANPATSPWKTRPDVKVWWEQGVSGNLNGAEGLGNLGPPFRGGSTDWFGPEYGFGQIIGDYYSGPNEAPVLIIKAAWGGHSLGGNFRPPSAVAKRGGTVGASYNEIFDNARLILNNLATKFPAAQHPEFDAVNYRYQIVGFALHQGYTDRVDPSLAPDYQKNLPDFIHDIRGAFAKPELPFVIASTGMDTTFVESAPYPNYTEVEQAQLFVDGNSASPFVRSSDTRSFMESAVDSPRNQGFHWHGNSRSYFRIGLLLADDMLDLLPP